MDYNIFLTEMEEIRNSDNISIIPFDSSCDFENT